MSKYEIIIYWSDEDGRFIAEVPELPGCMADGETRASVLSKVETVISEWLETAELEGREIPVPKGRLAYERSSGFLPTPSTRSAGRTPLRQGSELMPLAGAKTVLGNVPFNEVLDAVRESREWR